MGIVSSDFANPKRASSSRKQPSVEIDNSLFPGPQHDPADVRKNFGFDITNASAKHSWAPISEVIACSSIIFLDFVRFQPVIDVATTDTTPPSTGLEQVVTLIAAPKVLQHTWRPPIKVSSFSRIFAHESC